MKVLFSRAGRITILAASALLIVAVVIALAQARSPEGLSSDDAQTPPDPVALLRRANERMKSLDWIAFDFEFTGLFATTGHSRGRAIVRPARSLLDVSFTADLDIRVPSNGADREVRRATLALADGKAYRLDHAARTAATGSLRGGGLPLLRASNAFLLPIFLREEPFGVEIDMPVEHRWAGRAEVDGVLCDVIYLRFADDSPMGQQYFYLGADDGLVRRLIFASRGPAGSTQPVMWEFAARDVRAGTGEPPRPYAPQIPASWRLDDRDRIKASPGEAMPAWELRRPSGETVSAASTRGRIVVLDFWATWCPFFGGNLPYLERLTRDMRGTPVDIFAVHVWDDSDPMAFLQAKGADLDVLDVLLEGDALAAALNVGGTPTAVVIGPDGRILHRVYASGEARDTTLRKILSEAMAAKR